MTAPQWGFDPTPSTAPPVRQRSVAATPSAFNIDAGAPPAPPAPPDPFGYPGASNPNAGLWNQQGLGVPVSAPVAPAAAPSWSGTATTPQGAGGSQRSSGGSRWGWRALAAFVAGGALTAVGFGVGMNTRDDNQLATSTGATVPAATTSDPIVVTPPDLDTSEPAAFVASILGPSVVQINTQLGLGSGVIFDDGLIMTNNHVIDRATQISVRLSDGRSLPGTLVGTDPRTDIAVVSVGTGHNLTPATLATDQVLEVGQYTVAIGSPFDLQQTVTSGIVSAVNRPVYNGAGWNAMVQTDAAINPGNSGGALADREGRVIGINTAIQTDGVSATNAGIGFAMPITTAYDIATRILDGETLTPGFLGIAGEAPGEDLVGVSVATVTPGAAADLAGIQVGDRVISLDGAPVSSFEELAGLIQTSFPGDEVVVEIIRGSETLEITVTLGEK
ncbi:MAG: trypsin-like peptidase domain-containing protein [Acidimicrobiales bacterium]